MKTFESVGHVHRRLFGTKNANRTFYMQQQGQADGRVVPTTTQQQQQQLLLPPPPAYLQVKAPNIELCRYHAQFFVPVLPHEAEVQVDAAAVSLLPWRDGHVDDNSPVEDLHVGHTPHMSHRRGHVYDFVFSNAPEKRSCNVTFVIAFAFLTAPQFMFYSPPQCAIRARPKWS